MQTYRYRKLEWQCERLQLAFGDISTNWVMYMNSLLHILHYMMYLQKGLAGNENLRQVRRLQFSFLKYFFFSFFHLINFVKNKMWIRQTHVQLNLINIGSFNYFFLIVKYYIQFIDAVNQFNYNMYFYTHQHWNSRVIPLIRTIKCSSAYGKIKVSATS